MKTIYNHLDNTYKMSQWNVDHMYTVCTVYIQTEAQAFPINDFNLALIKAYSTLYTGIYVINLEH